MTDQDVRVFCKNLTENIKKVSEIPQVCNQYPDVVKSITARIEEKDAAIAFQGMQSGSGNEARTARTKGVEYHAQVQRRLTQTRRFSKKASY